MFRCCMALVLVVALWTGRAEAAELTGFGPIKFGMTKEQAETALEAAGIEGKWEKSDTRLVYDYPIHDRAGMAGIPEGMKLEVKQLFDDGLAIDATVESAWSKIPPALCFGNILYFVSAILHKYKTSIIIKEEVDSRYATIDKVNGEIDKIYVIQFESESFIQVWASADLDDTKENNCYFWVWYHAPVLHPIPF